MQQQRNIWQHGVVALSMRPSACFGTSKQIAVRRRAADWFKKTCMAGINVASSRWATVVVQMLPCIQKSWISWSARATTMMFAGMAQPAAVVLIHFPTCAHRKAAKEQLKSLGVDDQIRSLVAGKRLHPNPIKGKEPGLTPERAMEQLKVWAEAFFKIQVFAMMACFYHS